jgi:hypothetical protein
MKFFVPNLAQSIETAAQPVVHVEYLPEIALKIPYISVSPGKI